MHFRTSMTEHICRMVSRNSDFRPLRYRHVFDCDVSAFQYADNTSLYHARRVRPEQVTTRFYSLHKNCQLRCKTAIPLVQLGLPPRQSCPPTSFFLGWWLACSCMPTLGRSCAPAALVAAPRMIGIPFQLHHLRAMAVRFPRKLDLARNLPTYQARTD